MPVFAFSGLVPVDYPFAKDGRGQNLGRVEPGDEREFDTAPDQWWVPADGEASGTGSAPEPAGVTPDPGTEGDTGEPDGPQPAQPAIIPGD